MKRLFRHSEGTDWIAGSDKKGTLSFSLVRCRIIRRVALMKGVHAARMWKGSVLESVRQTHAFAGVLQRGMNAARANPGLSAMPMRPPSRVDAQG